jgi:CelD/BcsL family acetyltransferase involved in cellulose biosynthesis
MQIDVITRPEELKNLRKNWDDLYARDPDAHFFVSWAFLSTYLRRFEGTWFILAARTGPKGSAYVALLPLKLRTRMRRKTGEFYHEINMGGNHAADYTGIVCAPESAHRAIAAFAKHLKAMHWASLHLENLRMSESRVRCLTEHLADNRLTFRRMKRVNQRDNVDNCICPAIDLPDTWERYLAHNLSSNTRQKMRRYLRKLENSSEFRITHADASTVQRDVEILLDLWRIKWTERKGDLVPGLVKSNRLLFRHAFESGTLFLPVLWHHDRPLSALAIFVDPVKKSMLFHMVGRDETTDILPSGLILHGHCIRLAIEQGFRTYDFLRGNEPYKYSFGVRETVLNCTLVRTKTGRNLGDRLDSRALGGAFREATRLQTKGQFPQAENVYRQILNTDPHYSQALYALGHLVGAKGDHREAGKCFETLAALSPQYPQVWVCLGIAQQALNDHSGAVESFGRAMHLNPDLSVARYALGRSLLALQRSDEAVEAFTLVLQNGSPTPEDTAMRAKARRQLQKLKEAQPRYILRKPEPEMPAIQPSAPLGLTTLIDIARPAAGGRSFPLKHNGNLTSGVLAQLYTK